MAGAQDAPNDGGTPGAGVDAAGRAVLDPTQNVLGLVAAAVERLNDLQKQNSRHQRELLQVSIKNLNQVIKLRATYETRLSKSESARLDAIHVADVAAADRLATQVETTAVTLRAGAEAARVATADSLATTIAPLQASITELTRALYSGEGATAQKRQGSSVSQWAIGVLVAGVIGLSGLFIASQHGNTATRPSTVVTCSGTPLVCK